MKTQIKPADIFEVYGTPAKNFDALISAAARRPLTPGEKVFVQTFRDMLNGDATEQAMQESRAEWMSE